MRLADRLRAMAVPQGSVALTYLAQAGLAAGRAFCPHYLGGGLGLLHSLHLLAAVRGAGMLEVDANANPLREGVVESDGRQHVCAANSSCANHLRFAA